MKRRTILRILLVVLPLLMVNTTCPGDATDYRQKADELRAAGTLDVQYVDGLGASEYIRQGWLKPLPEDELQIKEFHPVLLRYFQRDGRLYALPHDFQTIALLVNPRLFEEAGLPRPTPTMDWDWDVFKRNAQELTSSMGDGKAALGVTRRLWQFLPFLYQGGGSLFTPDGTGMMLETEEARGALVFYTELVQEYALVVGDEKWPNDEAYGELLQRFADEEIAMILGSPKMFDLLRWKHGMEPDETILAVELPAGPGGKATIAEVRGFGLSRVNCEPAEPSEPELELLRFITSRESMSLWIGSKDTPSDYMPARSGLWDEWYAVHPHTEAFAAPVIEETEYLRTFPPAMVSINAITDFERVASFWIDRMLTEPEKITPEVVQKRLQDMGEFILEQDKVEEYRDRGVFVNAFAEKFGEDWELLVPGTFDDFVNEFQIDWETYLQSPQYLERKQDRKSWVPVP